MMAAVLFYSLTTVVELLDILLNRMIGILKVFPVILGGYEYKPLTFLLVLPLTP